MVDSGSNFKMTSTFKKAQRAWHSDRLICYKIFIPISHDASKLTRNIKLLKVKYESFRNPRNKAQSLRDPPV